MANRSGFMCYHRAADLLCSLPDEATGQIFKALLVYSRDGIVTDFSEHPASAFMSAIFNEQKRFLDEDSARYDAICATKAKAAHVRWKKKALQAHEPESADMHMHADACTSTGVHDGASKIDANNANMQYAISNLKETENTVVFSTKKTKKPQKRFTPPSVEEVAAYCRERKNAVNAEQFCDYYTANGWKVGRHSMKDWKAAVRTWEHKEAEKGTADNDRWTADNL